MKSKNALYCFLWSFCFSYGRAVGVVCCTGVQVRAFRDSADQRYRKGTLILLLNNIFFLE